MYLRTVAAFASVHGYAPRRRGWFAHVAEPEATRRTGGYMYMPPFTASTWPVM